ncbi:MAG: hypothetical protein AAF707_04660 [Pseudomonadota bacterium]
MSVRPLVRRIFAAFVLLGFAIGSSLFWNNGVVEWLLLGSNLAAAAIGFVVLHFRWRAQERKMLTPTKARDIFS